MDDGVALTFMVTGFSERGEREREERQERERGGWMGKYGCRDY